MTIWTRNAVDVFAPTDLAGNPRGVVNGDAQAWGTEVQRLFELALTSGLVYATQVDLYADLVPGANAPGLVLNDPDPTKNGLYRKNGATTTGSWTRLADVPGYNVVRFANVGAGTANAIVATAGGPVSTVAGAQIYTLNITANNTGNVTLNGRALLTNSGNQIAADGLVAGMNVAFLDDGTSYRLLSDQASAAIQAAAEAALAETEDFRDEAEVFRNAAAAYAALAGSVAQPLSFATVPAFEVDTVLSYDAGDGLVQVLPGTNIGAGGYNFEVVADDATDFDNENVNGVRIISRNDWVSCDMFGMIDGSPSVQDDRFIKACKRAIEDDVKFVIRGEYVLDHVDLSGITAGGRLRIDHAGLLIHVAAASGDMFDFGTRDYVEVIGPGEFDGQFADQTTKRLIMAVAAVSRFYLCGSTFRNVSKGAVHQQNPGCDSFIMEHFNVFEGDVHTGVDGGGTDFVLMRAGKFNRIADFGMIQTADPAANQNRNPAGVVYINTGSGAPSLQTIIERGYLENLGYSSAGNHLGAVDCYSRAESLTIQHLTIRKARFFGIRTNYAGLLKLTGNDIEVPSQMYFNDTTPYTSAAAISVGMIDRGYPSDTGNMKGATVSRNKVAISGGHNCHGISVANVDLDYLMELATVEKNIVSNSGSNNYYGLFGIAVANLVDDNDITGFDRQRNVQGGGVGSATAGLAKIKYHLRGGVSHGGTYALFARSLIANLDIAVHDHGVDGSTNAFSIRDAGDVLITGGNMGGAIMDATGNDSVTMRDVKGDGGTFANLATNDAYEVAGGASKPDRASWGFKGGTTTIATGLDATLTPGTTAETVIYSGTMGANRALTLSATGAKAGLTEFLIIFTATGGNLDVGGLKTLTTGQWCRVKRTASAYVLVAFGSL